MNVYLFLFGELLGAIRAKTVGWFAVTTLLIFSFLALFSCFFLLGRPTSNDLIPGETILYLAPELSDQEIEALYLIIRGWEEVQQINYRFAQENLGLGGVLIVYAMPAHLSSLDQKLNSVDGIVTVERSANPREDIQPLSPSTRIGLLVGLILNAIGCLISARRAFKELLQTFSGEIRLLTLTGTPESAVHYPLIALGILCGLVASFLFIVAIYLSHLTAMSNPEMLLHTASGLLDAGRIRTVSLLSLLLGLVLGSFAGTLGVSLINLHKCPADKITNTIA
jgi:cell division protein FtsX